MSDVQTTVEKSLAKDLIKSIGGKIGSQLGDKMASMALNLAMSAIFGDSGDDATAAINELQKAIEKDIQKAEYKILNFDSRFQEKKFITDLNSKMGAIIDSAKNDYHVGLDNVSSRLSVDFKISIDSSIRSDLSLLIEVLTLNGGQICYEIFNTKVKGQPIIDAATNVANYFKPITGAFVIASSLAQIIGYSDLGTFVTDQLNEYTKVIKKHFGNLINISSKYQDRVKANHKTVKVQLINWADKEKWVFADSTTENATLIFKNTVDVQAWSQTVFHVANDKLMGCYDGFNFKPVWGRDNENWFTGGTGSYTYSYEESDGFAAYPVTITVTNDVVNSIVCYALGTVTNNQINENVILVSLSNPRGKFMDNFYSQGWIRTSNGNFGNGIPCPQQLFAIKLA